MKQVYPKVVNFKNSKKGKRFFSFKFPHIKNKELAFLLFLFLSLAFTNQSIAQTCPGGTVGGMLPEDDRDGDGYCNIDDLDDDNDGILDSEEGCAFASSYSFINSNQIDGEVNGSNFTLTGVANNGAPWTASNVTTADFSTPSDFFSPQAGVLPAVAYGGGTGAVGSFTFANSESRTIRFHVRQLAANTITFSEPFKIITTGNGTLTSASNTTLTGQSISGTDANGTIEFLNPVNSVSWSTTTVNSPGDGWSLTVSACVDTDSDGIPDHLDLDSDNDGCADAIEGDEAIVLSQLNPDGSIDYTNQGGIDTDGVPSAVSSGGQGQGVGSSTNASVVVCCDPSDSGYLDTDGDDITDQCDLDDDNDGILDTVECPTVFTDLSGATLSGPVLSATEATYTWSGINIAGVNATLKITVPGTGSFVVWNILSIPANGYTNSIYTPAASLGSADGFGSGIALANNATRYAKYELTLDESAFDLRLHFSNVDFGRVQFTGSNTEELLSSGTEAIYTPATRIWADINGNHSNPTRDGYGSFSINPNTGSATSVTWEITDNPAASGTSEYFGFTFSAINNDTDGDGIQDCLDLDSDNDGCPDAIEGDEAIVLSQLNPDGSIDYANQGGIDTDGVPSAVSTGGQGQGVGSSTNASVVVCCDPTTSGYSDTDGDDVSDLCDSDDDNDGIIDTVECPTVFTDLSGATLSGPVLSATEATYTWSGINIAGVNATLKITVSADVIVDWNAVVIPANRYTNSIYTPAASPDSADGFGNGLGFEDDAARYAKYELTLDEPAFDLRLHFSNIDCGQVQFTGSNTEELLSSGTEAIYTPATRIWADTNDTNSVFARDGYGSFSINPIAGSATSVTWEITDNPVSTLFYEYFGFTFSAINNDTDGDGIQDCLDLDSDGDGCPDAVEAAVPGALKAGDVVNGSGGATNTTTSTANAVIDTALDPVGTNGYTNSLETVADADPVVPVNTFIASNYTTYAIDDTKNGCGVAMITQVYWKGAEKIVEITNMDPAKIIVPNGANVNFFNAGTTTARTATIANAAEINNNKSILFSSGTVTAQIKAGVTPITNAGITAFDNANDIITVSRSGTASSPIAYASRVDEVRGLTDNTAYVRIDETSAPNTTYTASEWVAFVDDNLLPYRPLASGGPQRHPHDPLLSEITSGVNTEANALLGLHRFALTTRTGSAWSNGFPDRSRHVVVGEDYNHSGSKLSARKLTVNSARTLSVTDNLLVVTNDIALNGDIRMVSTTDKSLAQLVQTHTGTTKVTGSGRLLIDQNSEVPSLYRYNYMSSPVNTIGNSTYTIESVLKDGTNPLNATSTIGGTIAANVAKDITFVNGYDGATTAPISLADYWIYTYAPSSSGYSAWTQKYKNGAIPQTDGFIIKGPGSTQNYTFLGSPKDGNLTSTTAINNDESYLVGNPFASALSAKKFIEDNLAITTGTLYFWQHVGELDDDSSTISGHLFDGYIGGYATRTLLMGTAATSPSITAAGATGLQVPGPYVPIGQGFFIRGDAAGGSIVFNNSQREFIPEASGTSVFFRENTTENRAEEVNVPVIKLGMDYLNEESISLHRQIGISFSSNNSFAHEKGYDAEMYDFGLTDVYWKLPNNDLKYVIAAVQEVSDNLEVPFDIVMDYNGTITIQIDEIKHINREVFIEDKFTNKKYLLNDTAVVLQLTKGTHTDRFALVFNGTTLSVDEVGEALAKEIFVFVDASTKELVIQNHGNSEIDKVELFSILGQKINQWDTLENSLENRLRVTSLSNQVYIVKVQTDNGYLSKKVIID